jgi:Kinesin-associated
MKRTGLRVAGFNGAMSVLMMMAVQEMSLTWEEKLHKTEQKQEDRRQALERMGISVQSSGIKVQEAGTGEDGHLSTI